jgi:hypothetical protein
VIATVPARAKGDAIVRFRTLEVAAVDRSDEERWGDLARRAVEPNPFLEPSCLIPAARHQTFGSDIVLAVAEEEGRFYGCLPVRSVTSWNRFHYPLLTSQVRRMTYLGTPLLDPARGEEAATAILNGVAGGRRWLRSRVLGLQWINERGPAAGYVRAGARRAGLDVYGLESFERGLLCRRADALYDDILRGDAGRERRRRVRRVTEVLGGPPVLVDCSRDPEAVERYIELEASGYKFGSGIAMTTVAGETAYFRDMCARFTAQGRLVVLSLEAGGHLLAMEMAVTGGEGLFMFKVSYDERFAHFGPGVELHLQAMPYYHRITAARWVDTCTFHKNETLLRLFPERRRIASWLINLGTRMDAAAIRAFLAAKATHKLVHDFRHAR